MIRLGLVDLLWRRRRFAVVVVVASLALGLALTMAGVTNQLREEGHETVALFGADEWVVPSGVGGPFTSSQVLDRERAVTSALDAGAAAATPILIGRTTVDGRDVNIVGYEPTGSIVPERLAAAGGSDTRRGGAIVDVTLGRAVGDRIRIAGTDIEVGATVTDTAFYFSSPTVFLPIDRVQHLLFADQDVASAVLVAGDVAATLDGTAGLEVRTNGDVVDDFDRVIKSSVDTIGIVSVLLWMMAAGVVAGIVFLTVLERTRDFATLKALGSSDRAIVAGLAVQASVVAVASALVAVGISRLISPAFSFPVDVPPAAHLQLLVVSLVVGLLASVVAVRRIVRIDPALAFGGTP